MKSINYIPISNTLEHPGDRRRFYGFTKKKKLIIENNINKKADVTVITQMADLSQVVTKREEYKKIIFDFCDGYLNEKLSIKRALRGSYKYLSGNNKFLNLSYIALLKKACKTSNAVVCSSHAQMKEIKKYNRNVFVISDIFNDEISVYKNNYDIRGNFKVVWEGLASNLIHLNSFANILNKLKHKIPIEFHIITDKFEKGKIVNNISSDKKLKRMFGDFNNIIFHDWYISSFSRIIADCDLAIIPSNKLHNDLFEVKSANKLFILWTIGIPVLASYSIEHDIIDKHTNIDFICRDEDDWYSKIIDYYYSKEKRKLNVHKGLSYIGSNVSENKIIDKWSSVFSSIGIELN